MIFANTIGGDRSIQTHVYGIENTDSKEHSVSPNNTTMCAQKGKDYESFRQI